MFTAAVVGGLGSVAGAVIGALFLKGGEWFLQDAWRLFASSIGVLLVLLLLPGGLGGAAVPGPRPVAALGGPPPRHRRAQPARRRPRARGRAPRQAFEARATSMARRSRRRQGRHSVPPRRGCDRPAADRPWPPTGGPRDHPHPAARRRPAVERRLATAVRHPVAGSTTSPATARLALLILTGLNAVDELSRASFSVVAPDHRRLLRRGHRRGHGAVRAGVRRRVRPVGAHRHGGRPAQPGAPGHAGRHRLRRLLDPRRPGRRTCGCSPSFLAGSQHRQGGHRAVAHLAARRLLRGRAAAPRVLVPPGRQRGRRARRRHRRRLRRRGLRLAGAVLRVRGARRSLLVARWARCANRCAACRSAAWSAPTPQSLETEEEPPSLAEGWRMCWQIDSLRRIYRTLPFLTPAVAGLRHLQLVHVPRRVRAGRVGPGLGRRAGRGPVAARRPRRSAPGSA